CCTLIYRFCCTITYRLQEIAYSKIYGQYFYTIGAIKDMLNANAVQSSDEYVHELIAKGKSYIEKGRKLKTDKK
ncbi:MAG: hypothetical protein ACOH2V_08305, partial [Candidatus Saccharimonadaceae bacterium]